MNSSSSTSNRSSFRTILVVEDEPKLRELLARRLAMRTSIRVLEAGDALAARTILVSNHVDLIVSDHVMPGNVTGTELLEEVKQRWPHIKRVLFSGYATADWVADLDYLVLSKPVRSLSAVADMLVALARDTEPDEPAGPNDAD